MKMAKEKHDKGKKSMSISCSLSTFLSATRAIVAKAQAHKGHWPKGSIMKFMNSRHGRLAVAFALASTLALIAACGGGGSGGGTTPPPPPPDPVDAVITLGATTPANGATDVKVGDPLTVAWSVDKGVYDTSSLKLTCDGSAVAGTWDHGKTGGTFTQAAALPRGATCVGEVPVSAKGENGGKAANEKLTFSFQTEAPVVDTYWNPPPTFTPPGVKVFGANQLPDGCNKASDQCWKDAVASGLVKFISTPATMVGNNSRPIVFAYFRNTTAMFGVVGLWNVLPMYADDGSLVGFDIGGGTDGELDMASGNAEGAIFRIASSGTCGQFYWNGTNWATRSATCPP